MSKIFSKFYIDFSYLLRQYIRILIHPINHFLHCIQLFSIYLKKMYPKSQWGLLTPKTPLASGIFTYQDGHWRHLRALFSKDLTRNGLSEFQNSYGHR